MPQGEAMRLELVFQRRTIRATFNQCGARDLIYLDNFTEIAQVKGDGCLAANPIDPWLDPAADARAAPERRQRGADTTGPIHHGGNLGFVARICDNIGRAAVVAEHGSHVVWV